MEQTTKKQIKKEQVAWAVVLFFALLNTTTFLTSGWFIFKYGDKFTPLQASLGKYWLWFSGMGFLLVMAYYFASAVPQFKDFLIILRNGKLPDIPQPSSFGNSNNEDEIMKQT